MYDAGIFCSAKTEVGQGGSSAGRSWKSSQGNLFRGSCCLAMAKHRARSGHDDAEDAKS